MAKRLVAVALDDHSSVFVEVDCTDALEAADGLAPVASVDEIIAKTSGTVTTAMEKVIVPTVKAMFAQIAKIAPKEVELEFGLKMSAEAGVVFASTQSEGHIQVTMKW